MADNQDFTPEELEAFRAHLDRTRREASTDQFKPAKPKSVVLSQFDEPVVTPVEEGLDGADPQSLGGVVNDYRDVASEASKQAVKRQRKVAQQGGPGAGRPRFADENPDELPPLNDRVNHPHPEPGYQKIKEEADCEDQVDAKKE